MYISILSIYEYCAQTNTGTMHLTQYFFLPLNSCSHHHLSYIHYRLYNNVLCAQHNFSRAFIKTPKILLNFLCQACVCSPSSREKKTEKFVYGLHLVEYSYGGRAYHVVMLFFR